MNEQQMHEAEIFEAFVDWLLKNKSYMLQYTPFIDGMASEARSELNDNYMSAVRVLTGEYVDVSRGYPEQPVWCSRHHMQTCHRCFALDCGDNNMHPVKSKERLLVEAVNSILIMYTHLMNATSKDDHRHLAETRTRLARALDEFRGIR